MKKMLYISISSLVILGILAGCAPAIVPTVPMTTSPVVITEESKQTTNPVDAAPLRTISVVGTGQVYLVPDVAYIYVGVHSQSENVSTALNDNNEQAKQVSDALKALGVEEKDIQTTSFNIYPQQQYEPGTGVVTGTLYMVDNTVYVTVRDLKQLGLLLDTVVRSGANSINGINFDVVDKEKAQSNARDMALKNARSQAEELAKASGLTLGEIQAISTGYTSSPMAKELYGIGGGGGGMAASSPAPISAGQLVLQADVSVVYQLQ